MIWNSNHHVIEFYHLTTYYFLVLTSLPHVGQVEFLKPRLFSCYFGHIRSNSENAWPACVMLAPTKWLCYLWMYFRITLWWLFNSYVWIGFEMTLEWFWNNFEMTSTCSVCSSCSERWIDVALIFICFHLNLVIQFYFEFSTSEINVTII